MGGFFIDSQYGCDAKPVIVLLGKEDKRWILANTGMPYVHLNPRLETAQLARSGNHFWFPLRSFVKTLRRLCEVILPSENPFLILLSKENDYWRLA
jgi:hypothetical protein